MADEERAFKCTVSREAAEKIEGLAERMGLSPTRMASELLQAGLEDHEWIIRVVSSAAGRRATEVAKSIEEAVRALAQQKRKPARR
jgi:hypothetical protein